MTKPNAGGGYVFVLMSSVGYAFIPTFTKFIYGAQDLHPFDVAMLRFGFAVPLMWLVVALWQRFGSPVKLEKPLPRFKLMLTGTLLAAAALCAFFGLQYIDAGLFVVLFYTYPAMTSIITALLGEPLPLRGWIALSLTMLGVALIAPQVFTFSLEGDMFIGVMIALLNALVVALFMVWNGRIQRGYPTTALSSAWSLTGTLLIMVPLLLTNGITLPSTPQVWGLFLGMSSLSTVLPVFGLIMGVRALGASRASILGTLEPVLSVLLAYLLLGERMLPLQLLGGALILASIFVLEVRFGNRKTKPAAAIGD